jgi:hypothetical protein
MKILTKQLFAFGILLAIYTLVFRIGLSFFIGQSAWVIQIDMSILKTFFTPCSSGHSSLFCTQLPSWSPEGIPSAESIRMTFFN